MKKVAQKKKQKKNIGFRILNIWAWQILKRCTTPISSSIHILFLKIVLLLLLVLGWFTWMARIKKSRQNRYVLGYGLTWISVSAWYLCHGLLVHYQYYFILEHWIMFISHIVIAYCWIWSVFHQFMEHFILVAPKSRFCPLHFFD